MGETVDSVKSIQIRQLLTQAISLGMIVTSSLIIWKALICVTGSESPVVVVLSESMEPGFQRGDILFLHMSKDPIRAGEIVVFNIDGRDIPIVHRVIKVHERKNTGEVDVLTKGAHPTKKSLRDETLEDYEDLQLIFEQGLATGKNAIGLGDDTDAPTFGAKDDEPFELDPRSFGYAEKEGSQASGFLNSTLPRSRKGPSEKQPLKKRAKGVEGGESSNSNMDGDNNPGDDRLLYAKGQLWLHRHHIMGRAVGFLPYVGWVTIIMTEKPIIKYILIGALGLLVISSRD
ncbi:LOW QUALITY PROTEIN: hypothetical protein HID58_028414 [Brassica napus]|uniref:signal peptidase I n=1 Tax=Brassica napus TaxID=3708 RepID=A0ABQ8CA98_BRANA|nr:LOW QUALITY PROTEIN: hypothetical protein HID58_028414 [Brassica napus]